MNQFFAYDYCKQTILERAGDIMDVSVGELPAVMNSGTLVKQKQPRILYILLSHKGKQNAMHCTNIHINDINQLQI